MFGGITIGAGGFGVTHRGSVRGCGLSQQGGVREDKALAGLQPSEPTTILRGGCAYQPQGSFWSFPQAYRNDQHSKSLLMSPDRDRSGSIGCRCAAEAQ